MSVVKSIASKSTSGVRRLFWLYNPKTWKEKGIVWSIGLLLVTYLIVVVILGVIWSQEPDTFDLHQNALNEATLKKPNLKDADLQDATILVPGYLITTTTIGVANTLLDKPGGYLSNDVMPPGVYLDNIPNWEYGVLVQLRDMVRTLRNDFSRAQSQSIEDKDLQVAEPQFNFDSESWILPSTEGEYQKGIDALRRYAARLADSNDRDGQFYVRVDNLREYLGTAIKRLGNIGQRLSASVGQVRFNTNLAGDSSATQSTPTPPQLKVKTPWLQLDDVFYEARGTTWAMLQFLKAIQIDFQRTLADKNAEVSLAQVIRELEDSQQVLWPRVVLNGTGFGVLANHSLVMSSYVGRANSALINLRDLLQQG